MNTSTALGTAFLRGLYWAAGSGALVFLGVWATTDELKGPLVAGGAAALTALGFRGGAEGIFDERRNTTGNAKSSDVGQPDRVVR